MRNYIIEKNNKMNNFYTSSGISVYIKDPLINGIDMEEIMQFVENKIPSKFMTEVEMVIVGEIEEFRERQINALYKDGCLYITNI